VAEDIALTLVRLQQPLTPQAQQLQRYETVLATTTDAVLICDTAGSIEFVNAGAESLLEVTAAEVLGSPANRFCPPERLAEQQHLLHQAMTLRAVQTYQTERISSSGKRLTVEISLSALYDSSGAVSAVAAVIRDISEHRQALQRLKEQEKVLSEILEGVLSGYWDWNIPAGSEYLSPGFKRMFGYRDDEMANTPQSWQKIIEPDDLPRVLAVFERHIASHGQEPFYNEIRYRHKNGSVVWIICAGRVIEWAQDGSPLRMIGCHVDITALKRAEQERAQALAETTQRTTELEALLRSARLVLEEGGDFARTARTIFDEACTMTGASAGSVALLKEGCAQTETVLFEVGGMGCTASPAYPPPLHDMRAQVYETKRAAFANALMSTSALPNMPPGHCLLHNVLLAPLLIDNRVVGMMGLANKPTDFTEQDRCIVEGFGHIAALALKNNRTLEALRTSEATWRNLFENMNTGAAIYEPLDGGEDFRFVDINPAGERFSQVQREHIRGKLIREVFPGVAEFGLLDALQQALKTGLPQILPLTLYKDERVQQWVENRVFCLHSGNLVAMFEDRTEQYQLEQRMRQAEKMEAIGKLAGGIAHDFNNVLGGIIGYSEMSLDDVEPGSQLEKNLRNILRAGERAKGLVAQILSFSRQRSGSSAPLFVRPIIEEVVRLLKATLPASVNIQCSFEPEHRAVIADETRIHEIIMNLCTNAAHAMEEQGSVEIKLSERLIDTPLQGRAGTTPQGHYVVIEVADSGQGMGQEVLGRIFEPFYTTKAVGKGTGMGLSVVFGIVQSYGGNLTVHSRPQQGTLFTVFLPQSETAIVKQPLEELSVPGGNERILFVDDEQALNELAQDILGRLGYRVTTCRGPQQALSLFSAAPQDYDLIITDQTMPAMSGAQLAQRALALRADIPIILCTGYSTKIDEHTAHAAGITSFCIKPLRKAEFANLIRQALTKKESAL
jgi:PAS domain S-box-containing protein